MFPVLRCDPCRQKLNFLFDVLLLTLLEERRVPVAGGRQKEQFYFTELMFCSVTHSMVRVAHRVLTYVKDVGGITLEGVAEEIALTVSSDIPSVLRSALDTLSP